MPPRLLLPHNPHRAIHDHAPVRLVPHMNLRFDHPEFLLLGLLAIPLLIIGWRSLRLTDSLRRAVILGLRTIFVLALAIMLAGPRLLREHDHLTVIGLLDISGSVQRFAELPAISDAPATHPATPAAQSQNSDGDALQSLYDQVNESRTVRRSNIEYLRRWFRAAAGIKEPEDRFGLIVFDGRAIAVSAPTRAQYVDDNLDQPIAEGTNIEDAVRLGLAMFPPDTAKRLVLVTDGNETAGNVIQAVQRLSETGDEASADSRSSIPIDVLPIAYRVTRDVQVVRVEMPPTAQPGQTVTARIVLESTAPVSGQLTLRREGEPVDLNGNQSGTSRHVDIPAGQSVHLAQVTLGSMPINRFEAVFETDDPTANILPDNDRAEAFTATPSKGSVLVIDSSAGRRENGLVQVLSAAGIPASAQPPAQVPVDLLSMQNFDLIVLDNVAAAELTSQQQELLARYVNDLGGGLIMTGGENSFGAGGWKGSPVAGVLPVDLDPSRELRLPSAALVLVLDKSGSMNQPVAGARATQQRIANEGAALAIESLRADNLVGVITFDMSAYTVVPLQANENPRALADKVRAISADGGTNIEPALESALDMLSPAKVARKRVVFMTDGRSSSTENLEDLARRMAAADIQLTTIAVGDDADYELLEKLATVGGGEFYPVRDPRILPRVLVDSVQVINKPLVKEVTFTPRVLPTGSTLTAGMEFAPPLGGLVITSRRDDPRVWLEMIDADGDPLLAHWQAGLGRVAAFTSQSPGAGTWSQNWADWPVAATFWTQLARTVSRPPANQNAELIATIQDDRLNITFETVESESGAPEYLQVNGTVYRPDGATAPVRLRQSAPGRYETSVDANLAGNYIVALNPRQGTRQLAPAIGGANRSTSPEFRRYASNLGLLEEIVQSTGGRRLSVELPLAANLFDRTGMPRSVSALPAWRTILWWALALMLLDVACRRLAWDSRMMRNALARAVERVVPARVRGAEVATTLATLRRVSDDAEARREARSIGVPRLQPTGRIAPPPARDEHGNILPEDDLRLTVDEEPQPAPAAARQSTTADRQMPEPSKVAAALDVLLGRNKPAAKPIPPKPDAASVDHGASAAETTGSLLAAKRRARQKMQKDQSNER